MGFTKFPSHVQHTQTQIRKYLYSAQKCLRVFGCFLSILPNYFIMCFCCIEFKVSLGGEIKLQYKCVLEGTWKSKSVVVGIIIKGEFTWLQIAFVILPFEDNSAYIFSHLGAKPHACPSGTYWRAMWPDCGSVRQCFAMILAVVEFVEIPTCWLWLFGYALWPWGYSMAKGQNREQQEGIQKTESEYGHFIKSEDSEKIALTGSHILFFIPLLIL